MNTETRIPSRAEVRNLRTLSRMGYIYRDPSLALEWSRDQREHWVTSSVRSYRAALNVPTAWYTLRERMARYPSKLRASRTLEQWLGKIEQGENAKAAKVAAALLAALDNRIGHAETLFGNYFACREREGLISYCPANRVQEITEDGKWARAGRCEIKPARWARQILRHPEKFRDDEYAAFAEAFGGVEQGEKIEWKLLTTAEEISEAYTPLAWGETRDGETPHGICSCMWGEPVGGFYERVGARLLVGVRRDVYVARAVVWETRQLGTVVDRLYATPAIYESCRAHITTQGWAKKERDSNSSSSWIKADGTLYHGRLTVDLAQSVEPCRFYPYLDSFRWQYGDTLSTEDDGTWDHEYSRTCGSRDEGHHGQVQDVDGNWIDEDNAVCVDGDYYHSDDERIVFCERSQESILRSDAYEVDLGGRLGTRYIHEDFVTRA